MQEVASDHVGRERRIVFLKNESNNVVANVTLSLQLLMIVLVVGQKRGHVIHDLFVLESLVQRVLAGLSVRRVQAASEALKVFELDSLA